MEKGRLQSFSDGVIAIIITIMVLELKIPAGDNITALKPLIPKFTSYVLSFIYIGIYWNNHHHMFYAVNKVNGAVLWANLHLLFWLSLIPFVTGWVGENHFTTLPVALYGGILFMAAHFMDDTFTYPYKAAWKIFTYSNRIWKGSERNTVIDNIRNCNSSFIY